MKLESISFRNIGPYGNRIVDIELMDEGGLWLVYGNNGNGKSTLLNMSKALYYGKVDKLKKDEIANRFNKHGWISGRVKSQQGVTYNIERNFSPSSLSVQKDGVDLDIAGISNAQSFIDNEVTMMPYQIYSNVVSLSVNDFKSFLTMRPVDKREIIDRIFSIEVINVMNTLVKNEIKNVKFEAELIEREIMTLQTSIQNYQLRLEEAKKQALKDNSEAIQKLENMRKELLPKYDSVVASYNEMVGKRNSVESIIHKNNEEKSKRLFKIQNINNSLNLYTKGTCPTCNSALTSYEHLSHKESLENELNVLTAEIDVINLNAQKYSELFNRISDAVMKIQGDMGVCQREIQDIDYQLKSLNITPTNINTEYISDMISKDIERINQAQGTKDGRNMEMGYLVYLEKMLGNDGVKQQIIESYLPVLNSEISYTLSELHFPYTVEFDKEFEPKLQHLNIDITPETLSTGEKKKVDLAVLISIIRIMKRKYPHLNMFMLDEVLSSIDQVGITDIISFLQQTAKELHINLFIVNHSTLPLEYFDKRIDINKIDNFSEITIEHLT